MDTAELQSLKIKELTKLAQEMNVQNFAGLKKQELIVTLLEAEAKNDGVLYSRGILEVMGDGYGFLRSPAFNYLPGPDDIYVSTSQIKRFGLKTGHLIEGQVRPPKDNERFFALLRVETVNDLNPDATRDSKYFGNLTPIYPEEIIKLYKKAMEGHDIVIGLRKKRQDNFR